MTLCYVNNFSIPRNWSNCSDRCENTFEIMEGFKRKLRECGCLLSL